MSYVWEDIFKNVPKLVLQYSSHDATELEVGMTWDTKKQLEYLNSGTFLLNSFP